MAPLRGVKEQQGKSKARQIKSKAIAKSSYNDTAHRPD
jgi:hypothetical protein